jgi:EmrB/QacA subfamily drug resistance transporter
MERSLQNTILAVTILTGFVATFITSAINIALPLIQSEFRVSAVTLGWISLSYVLATAAVLMPAGRIADLFGRTRIYLIGLVTFTLFSFASAFAPNAAVLLVMRVFQGLASALLFPTHTALVILSHPPEKRGRALGLQVSGVYLGLTLGPILGGIIIHNVGWRGLFLIVGGLGFANCILPFWKLRKIDWREPREGSFDILGSCIWAIGLTVLLLGFSYLPDWIGALLIGAGLAGIILFFWWETRATNPILNVDLLRRNRVFAFSNVASFINYSATFAMTFLMSLYLQYNRGLDAQTAGIVLVAGMFVQAALSIPAGRMADRIQARLVASTGMALCVVGLLMFVFLGDATPYWYIITALCVMGVGFALFASPMTHVIMGSVERQYVGVASAIVATMRTTGQNFSMGIATLVLALVVGRHEIGPADYPNFLTSARITFAICAVLCVLGVFASLVKPRKDQPAGPGPGSVGTGRRRTNRVT